MKKQIIQPFPIEYKIGFEETKSATMAAYLLQTAQISEKETVELKIRHSKHSQKRAAQRSINHKTLMQVITFGEPYYRQGMTFYTVLDKDIPEDLDHRTTEKLRNLIVLLGGQGEQIVTCYYNDDPVKYIKRKGKELMRYRRA